MLEIIALFFLTRQVGRTAHDKGLKPSTWKLYTVLAWFAGEIAGAILGVIIFGPNNLFSIVLVALAGAITGYYILKANLDKRSDISLDDDINQIGRD
ncbi:MAG: hypothetical protein ABJA57_00355 [Ginsengibacter sp.]